MLDNDLQVCGSYHGHLRRYNQKLHRWENLLVHFGCGKRDCPICAERKRKKLLRRLRKVKWNKQLYLWTITTDPSLISPSEARATVNKRWHIVHRSIYRLSPKFHYFKVVELTKSGLPHIHFITDCHIDWHRFQSLLIKSKFGKVLHFKKIPPDAGVSYCCKYVSKSMYDTALPLDLPSRLWGNSRNLFFASNPDPLEGRWATVWINKSLAFVEGSYLSSLSYGESPAHAPPELDPVAA